MTNKNLLHLAEELVTYGRKKGADEIEVSIGEAKEFSVEIREGNIEKLIEAGDKGLSLKVIIDHRVATGFSSDLSKEILYYLIDSTIQRAKISSDCAVSEFFPPA